jgi:hypothetical protein
MIGVARRVAFITSSCKEIPHLLFEAQVEAAKGCDAEAKRAERFGDHSNIKELGEFEAPQTKQIAHLIDELAHRLCIYIPPQVEPSATLGQETHT